jgi:hypothetical protein
MARILFCLLFVGLCFNVQAKGHHDNDQDDDNDQDNHRGSKKIVVIEHRDRDDNRDRDDHRGFDKTVVVEKRVVVDRFSDNDRDVIIKYYDRKHKRIPPGQLKKMRHYEFVVGEPAPPEAIKVFMPLPTSLVPLLPPPPPGFQLFMAGDQVVRVEKHSHRVVDCVPIPGPGMPPAPLPPPLPPAPPGFR